MKNKTSQLNFKFGLNNDVSISDLTITFGITQTLQTKHTTHSGY